MLDACDLVRQKVGSFSGFSTGDSVITARVRSTREGNIYTWKCLSVHFLGGGGDPMSQIFGGGVPMSQIFGEGVPGLRFWGGSQVSDFWGESQVSDFRGGPRSQIFGAGVPGFSKGKIFWHQIWLDTCSDRKKNFCPGIFVPPPPP